MSTELQVADGERRLATRDIPLGRPRILAQRIIAGVSGAPIGIGLVTENFTLVALGIGACLAFMFVNVAVLRRRGGRFSVENNTALGALGRGELAAALAVFARWAPNGHAGIAAIARHNVSWTLIVSGRLDEALRIAEDTAVHRESMLSRLTLLPSSRMHVALCHTLLGNASLAETWYAQALRPVKAAPRPGFGGMLALVRGLLDCREGKAAEAAVALEHAWQLHEATMSGETLRILRVARAFALASADGTRNQGRVERILVDLKPRYEHEFAYLGSSWPEMATFLAAHQLDG